MDGVVFLQRPELSSGCRGILHHHAAGKEAFLHGAMNKNAQVNPNAGGGGIDGYNPWETSHDFGFSKPPLRSPS